MASVIFWVNTQIVVSYIVSTHELKMLKMLIRTSCQSSASMEAAIAFLMADFKPTELEVAPVTESTS